MVKKSYLCISILEFKFKLKEFEKEGYIKNLCISILEFKFLET